VCLFSEGCSLVVHSMNVPLLRSLVNANERVHHLLPEYVISGMSAYANLSDVYFDELSLLEIDTRGGEHREY
jgi:hypothetical protein